MVQMKRLAPWLIWAALAAAILWPLPASAQVQAEGRLRVILWDEPPTIGMYTIDSARVNDSLPGIATAEWPDFTDTVVAELHACTGLKHDPDRWALRTVAAPLFYVRIFDSDKRQWRDNEQYIGFTFPSVRRIYVVQSGLYIRGLIKHELLHALVAENGIDPRHNTPFTDRIFKRCFPKGR